MNLYTFHYRLKVYKLKRDYKEKKQIHNHNETS